MIVCAPRRIAAGRNAQESSIILFASCLASPLLVPFVVFPAWRKLFVRQFQLWQEPSQCFDVSFLAKSGQVDLVNAVGIGKFRGKTAATYQQLMVDSVWTGLIPDFDNILYRDTDTRRKILQCNSLVCP